MNLCRDCPDVKEGRGSSKEKLDGHEFEGFLCVRKTFLNRILSNSAALSNSTASLIIPPDFFAFKIYSRLSNSPALRV